MAKSLYIAGLEPGSGKAIAVLGFMEQLSGRLKSVGIFRPVTFQDSGPDRLTKLAIDLYRI